MELLLRDHYHCTEEQITQLMLQAETEPLSPWCGVGSHQEGETAAASGQLSAKIN